ncbi:MAG: hypothetical protein V8R27_06455 [Oscillospiraceae bacterium]
MDEVLDEDGNVLSQHNTTPVRQVISEETSADCPGGAGIRGVLSGSGKTNSDAISSSKAISQ